jgi:hypothetical protein
VHVLVNNAGAMVATKQVVHSVELTSLQNHVGPYYLTTLLKDKLQRTAAADATVCRIINVGSRLEKSATPNKRPEVLQALDTAWVREGPPTYSTFEAYGNSKLCNLLTTVSLAKQLLPALNTNGGGGGAVVAITVTPGMVNTGLNRFLPWWQRWLVAPLQAALTRTPEQGAAPIVEVATAADANALAWNGGFYGSGGKGTEGGAGASIQPVQAMSAAAQSPQLAEAVWRHTAELVDELVKRERR